MSTIEISSQLIEKINKTHENSIVMKESLTALKEHVQRQNGRIAKLEESHEKGVALHATYEERLGSHMAADEKEQIAIEKAQGETNKKIDNLSKTVWIGIGILTLASLIWPFVAPKLFL